MFKFIPAGLDFSVEVPVSIYVKYGVFDDCMKVLNQNAKMLQVQLPDRIITFAQDTDKLQHYKYFDWDEFLPLSPFHRTSNNLDYPEFGMVNYVANYGRFDKCTKSCKPGKKNPNRLKIISDSGGFQVAMGLIDYIDTKDLATFYNDNVDIGIVLDVPLYRTVDMNTLKYAAKVQKKNTNRLLDNLDSSVELLNVCHGYFPDKYKTYLNIVDDERIHRLCIGGLNFSSSIVSSLSSFIDIVTNYKDRYKHFHILGIYNPAILSLFIYLAENVFPDVLITSDASTPIQSARSRLYHLQREFNRQPERLVIGSIANNLTKFNKYRLLPCNCPVCRMVKYMDVFSFLTSNPTTRSLTIHNIYEINKSLMNIKNISTMYDFKLYKDYIGSMFKRHGSGSDTLLGLDFIQSYLDDGLDKANKRFHKYFNTGIFAEKSVNTFSEDGEELWNSSSNRKERCIELLDGYTKLLKRT